MSYFVTGATGFIGRNLVEKLLQREGTIYALVRAGLARPARGAAHQLRRRRRAHRADHRRPHPARARGLRGGPGGDAGGDRPLLPPGGDLRPDRRRRDPGGRQRRGDAPRDRARRARWRPAASTTSARSPPPASTRASGPRRCSTRPNGSTTTPTSAPSTSPSGWSATSASGPGGSTGRGSSSATRAPGRSTRSTAPTSSSRRCSGCGGWRPSWLPTLGIEGGEINIVPVDYVAAAIDHIAHKPRLNGRAFHLTDPNPHTAGEVINLFAQRGRRAADGGAAGDRRDRAGDRRAAQRAEAVPAGQAGRQAGARPGSACPPSSSPTSTTRPPSTRPWRRKR